jgi:hypothetical protein
MVSTGEGRRLVAFAAVCQAAGMLRKLHHALRAVLVVATTPLPLQPVLADTTPPRRGWLENVSIEGGKLRLEAKLDTGARTSAVNAGEVTELQRDGRDWVRFRVFDPGQPERGQLVLERPVARWVEIKRQHGASDRRPVVELDVCLGRESRSVEVSLTNRSRFNYPLLLGRNYLAATPSWTRGGRTR